jgi:predicted PurR-regulated permease PerM
MDRVDNFLGEKTPRRFLTVAIFVGLIVLFRELAVLLVFFVAFERVLGALSRFLLSRTRLGRKWVVLALVLAVLAIVAILSVIGIGRAIRAIEHARITFPERIAEMKETPLYAQIQAHIHDIDRVLEAAKGRAADAFHYAVAMGHVLLYAVIGMILAVIYHLELDELTRFAQSIVPTSREGTLLRWFGYLADGVFITIKLQLVVAGCNAVLTLPVLLLLHLPHPTTLGIMIFVTSLVPVVGNFVSGVVLSLLAFHVRGWLGVGVFVVLTFVLHKIESYYLNPTLTARHVKLPGFVIILSLIAWEHLLGFAGLFVSFPFLFVTARIRAEMRDEDDRAKRSTVDPAA